MTTRRRFIGVGGLTGAGLMLPFNSFFARRAYGALSPQIPLASKAIPKFVDPLPSLEAITAGTDQIELQMTEFKAQVLPTGPPLRAAAVPRTYFTISTVQVCSAKFSLASIAITRE